MVSVTEIASFARDDPNPADPGQRPGSPDRLASSQERAASKEQWTREGRSMGGPDGMGETGFEPV